MAKSSNNNRGLGRGLSALMADVAPNVDTDQNDSPAKSDLTVPIEAVFPNPDQPRRSFDDAALQELAESIREKGIIQPIVVRLAKKDGQYEIVAGERRWRAAQRAKLHQVPVVVRSFSDQEMLEVAIIENIQRADLNAIDEAAGFAQLVEKYGHTQEQLSQVLGKSRSHIANQMRLLSLPQDVQALVEEGKLSAGHARTLIGSDQALTLAKTIISKGLSVRGAERLTKAPKVSTKGRASKTLTKDADTVALEGELSANLGVAVTIEQSNLESGAGNLVLSYKNLDQLDDLLSKLST
ncbi:ParB/RepB/Spo0J family partition protein [Thalassobium sp. R2A62]|jgi:ParB family transcriptional regulator, chromosome partitioning protein|uniref:ParB/RepB/Spo0J family partition protein n=1 Tax=Thalassobium sp. R2A62 TaxID=633131 RepID=UPI0001B1CB49|nr:ParB/RepB/Spo0J family partition protein [Thalassobium sp. R2A62]EET47373.1 chromosome-partitioning protein ParB [Thalassobium sp. R2A62]MDG1801295.1 ParB/RepB/Spo0J family partition protein [Paracoccaceae bacterium]MDG2452273.1 ParB/RepB/Spo0J family partition protein [Paracoccaceae bacterium]